MSKRIRPLHYKRLIKIFERLGFKVQRYNGDHVVMSKAGARRPIIFQAVKDVPVFQIENNLKIAKISKKEFLTIIEDN